MKSAFVLTAGLLVNLVTGLLSSSAAFAADPYLPPVRTAQVSGVIQYAFVDVCKFEVSVPVYDQRKASGFDVPAYVDCVATIEGKPALLRTALTVLLKVDAQAQVDVKWLDVSMFAIEKKGKDLGATIGYISGSVASEDLEVKSLRLFTSVYGKIGKRDQYLMTLKMRETQL